MLTREDKEWIVQAIAQSGERLEERLTEEIAASEDRVYTRIKDGALSELRQDMDRGFRGIRQELGEMIGQVGARVDQVDGELKAFREEVNQRFDRLEP